MLSLAFSDVIAQMTGIRNAVEREAVAISDAFYDLQQFDIEKTREARKVLIEYTQAIIDDDWPALADDKLGRRAGQLKRRLSQLGGEFGGRDTQHKKSCFLRLRPIWMRFPTHG